MGVESEESLVTRYRPPIGSTERARRLRLDATRAERAMWRLLRHAFPDGRFRRQVPIRDYVADFASHRLKLVIEVDGGHHGGERDRERTRTIEAEGYRILRFWNNDVLQNADGVASTIEAALVSESTPTLTLPPQGGGNRTEPPSWHA